MCQAQSSLALLCMPHRRRVRRIDLNCTARVYRNIGRLYALNGSMDDAIRFFKQSLAVDPESAESYHYLADALAEKGDLREAIASYEGALRSRAM